MRKCSKPSEYIYLIMNKPCGYVCSAVSDSHKTVYELLSPDLKAMVSGAPRGSRLHTVGRLDCDTSGLLLLTNDGKFSNKITAKNVDSTGTSSAITKTYRATLKNQVTAEEEKMYIQLAAQGLTLPPEKKYDEQTALPAIIQFESSEICTITVCEGKFHEVRRIFRALGNEVLKLERIAIGNLFLPQELESGQWRRMELEEMGRLSLAPAAKSESTRQ